MWSYMTNMDCCKIIEDHRTKNKKISNKYIFFKIRFRRQRQNHVTPTVHYERWSKWTAIAFFYQIVFKILDICVTSVCHRYGQMTAGSYCYIGPQGIVHGTTVRLFLVMRNIYSKNTIYIQYSKLTETFMSTFSTNCGLVTQR
jgi:hypothetical protein